MALLAVSFLLGLPAGAQTMRPTLDYASAAKIRDTCLAWAETHDRKVAIAVTDARGMLVTYAHMDGVSTGVGEVARWKANSAGRFGRATSDLAALKPPANMPDVATVPGGVPIYAGDVLLGGVGTSGASGAEDVACGRAGVEAAGLRIAK